MSLCSPRFFVVLALLGVGVVAGCRNDIVGEPPRADAGFEGEGEGEGEGEDCSVEVPAISIRLAEPNRFISCVAGSVTLTDGDFTDVATVVTLDNGECRHQGGFGRPGTYVVDIVVAGYQSKSVTLTAPPADGTCGDPVTASASMTLEP